MTGTNEYKIAYEQLNCILQYYPQDYIDKIPNKLLIQIQENKNDDLKIEQITEKNILRKTRILLAILKYNYWCENEEEKEAMRNMFRENEKKYQQELYDKYNPDLIFHKEDEDKNENSENRELVVYQENNGILNKIKAFLSKILRKDK